MNGIMTTIRRDIENIMLSLAVLISCNKKISGEREEKCEADDRPPPLSDHYECTSFCCRLEGILEFISRSQSKNLSTSVTKRLSVTTSCILRYRHSSGRHDKTSYSYIDYNDKYLYSEYLYKYHYHRQEIYNLFSELDGESLSEKVLTIVTLE